jgi:hypothetical protein
MKNIIQDLSYRISFLTHEKVKRVLLWNNMVEDNWPGEFTGILPQNIQHKFLPTY